MRVLFLEAPQELLEDRSRLGLDARDEMWDGVLHLVTPLDDPHRAVAAELWVVLQKVAVTRGLRALRTIRLYRSPDDYRVPDVMVVGAEPVSDGDVGSAELVVEIRSGSDEAYEKLDFYRDRGVREIVVVPPHERRVEMLRVVDGILMIAYRARDGAYSSEVLGATFRTVDGELEITWDGGSAVV